MGAFFVQKKCELYPSLWGSCLLIISGFVSFCTEKMDIIPPV
ncbi:hypothetical protein FAES_4029 [Fibrella aestuarina BUZ 2]|uniref:Uncharacterized protein n=1 Tax=Fibrella aestuarina BUZ 2 TaxID=1166018 RepID=I0KD26_9BACT|nr:hypothetical protein FAES_4029 [Fibrella aestuarina BUZ 2]